jgi:hypothetical protein
MIKKDLGNLGLQRSGKQGDLVKVISAEPGFNVPGATPLRILRESTCPCTDNVIVTVYFFKVEFTEGTNRGKVGWVCRSEIDDPRTRSL